MNGAELLVSCLEAQGVEYIFGIPGAKIDSVFNALLDSSIQLVLCRHEQNAAFIAAGYGRLTGKPGVVLVTSGPGVANLVTGLLTATTEGDPVVAIAGQVSRAMKGKQSHQALNNVKLMTAVTKSSREASVVEEIPELVATAFRIAKAPASGASFISLPQDLLKDTTVALPIPFMAPPLYGTAPAALVKQAAICINQAKQPVILLGQEASRPENVASIRALLKQTPLAVVGTYQAAGVISEDLLHCFIGRIGLFKNQPGDHVLDIADVVVTIGFNAIEYDPEIWNADNTKAIIHINYTRCEVRNTYHPVYELLGDIATTLQALSEQITPRPPLHDSKKIVQMQKTLTDKIASGQHYSGTPIHPLRFIYELHNVIDHNATICCDVGSVYMWMARYFFSYNPHHLLFSNGQQTLGVGLPWAIACHYAHAGQPIISISGDGGFLFSAMELETAVRERIKLIHFIWRDGTYNMVLEQELMKYKRKSGVDLGRIHIPEFASAFGAVGFELQDPNQFEAIFTQAMQSDKPVLIDVPIDYSDNLELFKTTDPDSGH